MTQQVVEIYEKRDEVYAQCFIQWGFHSQVLVAVEELNEASCVFLRTLRDNRNVTKEQIISELADMQIVGEEMKFCHGITDQELKDEVVKKLTRLSSYLEGSKRSD